MMIERAAAPFIGKFPVSIVILEQHDRMYNAREKLVEVFGDTVNIISLPEPTKGPADTIYQAIMKSNMNLTSPFLIKDSDGFYNADIARGNAIYVCNLNKNPNIKNVHAKSYTITNDQGLINSVVEKQIVSNNFCAGGYQFESVQSYIDTFNTIRSTINTEIFVSNIIDYMIARGSIFVEQEVRDFHDVGTSTEWFEFNDRPTYFCDIDGTIIRNKHPQEECEPLTANIELLQKEVARGCKIVFCTARPKRFEEITRLMLADLGFTDFELLMAINHSRRVLINDYAPSNPYPAAEAINMKRDSDNLKDFIY
jgi:hypothetical protein